MIATQKGAVTTARIDYSQGNNEHLFYLTSDLHIDSVHCNRDLMFSDFDEAKARGAKILIFGDLFDAMQGKFDPRRNMDELRPEYRSAEYFDVVVRDVARLLKPYAENIMLITLGNHETAITKNNSISLIDRLVWMMNLENKTNILQGTYGGWVRFLFEFGNNGQRTSAKLKYHHGFGGDAPVTRGVIHTNRQNVYIKDADVIVNGHNHNSYYVPIVSETLSASGKVTFSTTHHVRTPGYKSEYGDGATGWVVEKGMVPKPLGGAYIKLNVESPIKNRPLGCRISVQPVVHAPF